MGNESLIAKAGKALDKARARTGQTDLECSLLKPTTDANRDYDVVHQLGRYWFFDTEKKILMIAETRDVLGDPMAEATNVQIGEEVFPIAPDDITPPDDLGGSRVYWIIQCEKFAKRSQYSSIY